MIAAMAVAAHSSSRASSVSPRKAKFETSAFMPLFIGTRTATRPKKSPSISEGLSCTVCVNPEPQLFVQVFVNPLIALGIDAAIAFRAKQFLVVRVRKREHEGELRVERRLGDF